MMYAHHERHMSKSIFLRYRYTYIYIDYILYTMVYIYFEVYTYMRKMVCPECLGTIG